MRAIVCALMLFVVLAGSFVIGAVHVLVGETWPDLS
jgi:hypothetical protein